MSSSSSCCASRPHGFEVTDKKAKSCEESTSYSWHPHAMSRLPDYSPEKTPAPEKPGFLALSRTDAEAFERMASDVVYTEEEENAVRRKIDIRILPIIVLTYISNQLDRTNIGNAHVLAQFNKNFNITSNNRWTLCLSIFYVGYCLLEVPANIFQRRIGANRFFFMILLVWGTASLSFVYSKGYAAVLVLRVLVGTGEAGCYAGMIYYLSFWYKRRELAFRISLCMTGTVPGWMGGLLAFALVRAHTSVLAGWQFLYLVEAIPTLIMAFVILFFLPAFPFTAPFLSDRDKAIAIARLKDHKPKSHGGTSGLDALKLVFLDLGMWMFVILYCSFNICVATISYFLPTIIKGFGYSPINVQGLAAAPYLVGWGMVWLQAWHSDKTRDRGYHVMIGSLIACAGYVILAAQTGVSHRVCYFACFLVVGGAYSLFPLVMSWAANNTSPTSKRGVGTAFIVSVANCVSIAAPQIYFDPSDNFRKAYAMSGSFMFLAFVMAFLLRLRFDILNGRREVQLIVMTMEENAVAVEDAPQTLELADTDVRFRYMT